MTLNDHLEVIQESYNQTGNDDPQKILFFQLYLLCLGKAGIHFHDARFYEPFRMLYTYLPMADIAYRPNEFSDDQELQHLDKSDFEEAFFGLLNRSARNSKGYFDHLQPKEITDIVAHLCDYHTGKTIYNPYAGFASYADAFHAGDNYYGEEYNVWTWAIGVLRLWMTGNSSKNYLHGDSLNPSWDNRFDLIVSTPPVGRIEGKKSTYTDDILSAARTRLKESGTLVAVTTMSALLGDSGRRLVTEGLLEMVIALPPSILYWSSYPPVIIRIKADKPKEAAVTFVDGSRFYTTGGRRSNILDVPSLIRAIEEKSAVTASVSHEELMANDCRLTPALYVRGQESPAPAVRTKGKQQVFLRDLGEMLRLQAAETSPKKGIRVQDLVSDPALLDIEPSPLEGSPAGYRKLDQSALLIFATIHGVRLGYAHASEESPVYIAPHIHAFVPDAEKAGIRYVALQLAKVQPTQLGTSKLLVTRDELALTAIPIIPLDKQKEQVERAIERGSGILRIDGRLHCEGVSDNVIKPGSSRSSSISDSPRKSRAKINVIFVGTQGNSEILPKSIHIKNRFDAPSDATEWVKNGTNLDAVIVRQAESTSGLELLLLCEASSVPVFIISDDLIGLEDIFKIRPDYFAGHCFAPGDEAALVKTLREEVDAKNTPEYQIRKRYEAELEAAGSIDRVFPRKESFRENLEAILLSNPKNTNWFNQLRSIRDAMLDILIQCNYLPEFSREINKGGMANLVADRVFFPNTKTSCYIVLKEVFSRPLSALIKASTEFLNTESHSDKQKVDSNVQYASIHMIMGMFCRLAEMIDSGELNKDSQKKYWQQIWIDEYETDTVETVQSYKKFNSEYLYAGHVLLGSQHRIKEGDSVRIHSVRKPNDTIMNGAVMIYLFSNDYDVVS